MKVGLQAARRMAVRAQLLEGPSPRGRVRIADVRRVAETLGCLQLDPTSAVARSHLLVLHARLGQVDERHVERLAYDEHALFEYWCHEASLCCAADLPVHAWWMRSWPGPQPRAGGVRWSAWLDDHAGLAAEVLARIEELGAVRLRDLGARRTSWLEAWGQPGDVSRVIDLLWVRGGVLVGRREAGERLWDLGDRCLPDWASREALSDDEACRRAALRSLRCLGVARAPHIRDHFTRKRYPGLAGVLASLAAAGDIQPVEIDGLGGAWWVAAEDAPVLGTLDADPDAFRGRTALLSPFDNLLCDRARTEQLFGFAHRLEIYTPAAKRRWGFFVLPVLQGDRLVARCDLRMDRSGGRLIVNEVYDEPGTRLGAGFARSLRTHLERLAAWQGATEIEVTRAPAGWAAALRA